MSNYIVCPHCEKKIEYERPLFCPMCGEKLEPVDDLISGDESEIYPWSNVAPRLMRIFLFWVALVIPVGVLLGRKPLIWMSFGFIFLLALISLTSICSKNR